MGVCFRINAWAACAPGLATPDEWRRWAEDPTLPEGDCDVALPEIPALQRRRLSPLGRLAAWAATRCQGDRRAIPIVFASRYGDADRSLALLDGFAAGNGMSPAEFTLSVHNAIGAMYSIVRGENQASSSIAAGPASAAAGCIEAAALLADGHDEVMLVCYDAALPGDYREFQESAAATYAWAWRMTATGGQTPSLSLDWEPVDDTEPDAGLPFALEALRFALSRDASSERTCAGRRWRWSRHA